MSRAMTDHTFCKVLLRQARADNRHLKAAKGLSSWFTNFGHNKHFEIRNKAGQMVWQGDACCAYEAKMHAIDKINDAK